jgi:predicted peptidase
MPLSRRSLLLSLAVASASVSTPEQGTASGDVQGDLCSFQETGFLNRTISVGRNAYRFQVYLPPEFTIHRKWPVLLHLHGAGQGGEDGLRETNWALGDQIRWHSEQFPMIVIFPQARAKFQWFGEMGTMAMKTLETSIREFQGDEQRIYLMGGSMGGYGAWHLAWRFPRFFAAAVIISGGIVPVQHLIPDIPDEMKALLRSADPYAEVARKIGKLPVWVFHGGSDDQVPVTEARNIIKALKAVGADATLTEFKGLNHIKAGVKAYSQLDAISWLLEQRRQATPA